MSQVDDPGWWSALRVLVPFAVLSKRARQPGPNALVPLRMIFLSFVMALLLFGFLLIFITGGAEKKDVSPALVGGVIAAGLIGVAGARWSQRRPLVITSAADLANSYRTNMFVGIALSEPAALLAFVACMITGRLWLTR
jgi:F0F1-type ATP synthase membrane subunit c/vacuolar-type H+-ATPase subunit K